jgi:hypothetical protein
LVPVVCRGLPWFAVACHGLPWLAMVCRGLPWLAKVHTTNKGKNWQATTSIE